MPSPVRVDRHGRPHARIVGWLIYYEAFTPGVAVADNTTARLDQDNEPQPDAMLYIALIAAARYGSVRRVTSKRHRNSWSRWHLAA